MSGRDGASRVEKMNARQVFLDTNIFTDSFDKSAPKKAGRPAKLIRHGIEARQGSLRFGTGSLGMTRSY